MSMLVQENISLKAYNTFHIDVKARLFAELNTYDDIGAFIEYINQNKIPYLILGGGSNILFTKDFDGLVVHINTQGIRKVSEDEAEVILDVAAGVPWENLIDFCIANKYYGLENLTDIPGQVGSCPIQNIGAYGSEVKDSIYEVYTVRIDDYKKLVLSAQECRFGYRDSIFKNELKNKVVITNVWFRLSKKQKFNLTYKGVEEEVKRLAGDGEITIMHVREAIKNIRRSKIPDINIYGSAGSFFKNPIVDEQKLRHLKSIYPDIVSFPVGNNQYKLSAAWLIEQCGWKAYRKNDVGVYEKQPLIIINTGNACGKDILELSERIRWSVSERFGVQLEPEVNIV